MKGDFSRFTFNSKNHYSRVLMQQGRVQIDADWNEQLDISAYRTETEITDFIGQSGAPEHPINPDAKPAYTGDSNYKSNSFKITANGGNIWIGKGRYYVEGMLFENDWDVTNGQDVTHKQDITFDQQPDVPGEKLPTADGLYLAYLDVWQHHVTALEVPALREAALGGADTTTRVKNVWRVKLYQVGPLGAEASLKPGDYAPPKWQPDWETPLSTGKLTVQVKQPGAIVENQLYRVEIHQGNASEADRDKTVTFKWSQDNGAIAAQVEPKIDDHNITIKNAGRDTQLAFPIGQLVEFSNASLTLRGEPGILATVEAVQGNRLTVKWKTADNSPPKNLTDLTIVRRWDSKDAIAIGNSNQEHELEQSITITFESNKLYKTGDYWLIPSRALTGGIEWSPETQRSHGIQHRYCSLALLKLENDQSNNHFWTVLADCRSIFKPITSGLVSKDGDTMTGDLTINRNLLVGGNVGIGTLTPQNLLSVAGGVTIGASYRDLTASPNGLLVEGNVGIGTVEPGSQLSVTQGVAIGSGYAIYNNASGGSLLVEGNVGIGTPRPASKLSVSGGAAIGSHYSFNNPAPSDGLIVEGNVGIGTTNPQAKLEISGSLQATADNQTLTALHIKSTFDSNGKTGIKQNGLVVENGKVGIGTTTPKAKLEVQGDGQQEVDLIVNGRLKSDNNDGGLWIASNRFVGGHSTDKMGFYSSSAWRLTVQSDGNVGIGTTTPQAKLEISGSLLATVNNQTLTALHIKSTFDSNGKTGIKQNGLIVENGNVGIGTVAPDARLEVRGGITKLQQEDWIDVILPPSQRADREFMMASCFKDSVGIVHLRGTITWTVPKGQDIFTLPDGYKPQSFNTQTVWIDDRSNDINGTYSTGSIFIKPSGGVSLNFSSAYNRLCIDGITFRAA